jgi:SAM-dependent methyltransferase
LEAQLAYARTRPASRVAQFRQGDAMAQPFPDDTFDAAVMPRVIFFVPELARGVAEMARVVCPGGAVTAYAWDMVGGGFPYEALHVEMRGMGIAVPLPPSPGASRIDAMRELWTGAGLDAVETREITVRPTFADFDDYWTTIPRGTERRSNARSNGVRGSRASQSADARACRQTPLAVSPILPGPTQ